MLLFAVATAAAATVASAAMPQKYQPRPMLSVDNQTSVENIGMHKIAGKLSKFGSLRSFDTGTHTLGGVYQMPQGVFYGGLINDAYISWTTLVPTDVPLNVKSIILAARNDANTPNFDDWDGVSRNWEYYTGYTFADGDFRSSTSTGDSITMVAPCDVDVALYASPKLTIGYYDWTDNFQLFDITPGGKPFTVYEGEIAKVSSMINPLTNFATLSLCGSTYYGDYVLDESSQMTANAYSTKAHKFQWASLFRQQFNDSLVNTQVIGYYSEIGYAGVPYALSSMTMNFRYVSSKGGELMFNVVRMDGDNITDDVLYTYNVKVPASQNEANYSAEVSFVSTNEYDEELSYMMIDCPVFIEVYGLENFEFFAPHSIAYDPNNFNSYSIPSTGGSILNLYGEKAENKVEGIISPIDVLVWTTVDNRELSFKGLDLRFDIEYPTLAVSRYQINGNETHEVYKYDNKYAVDLAEGQDQILVFLATSAEYADELYIDESELPSWLSLDSVEDYYQEFPQSGGIQRAAVLTFTTDGTYEARVAQVNVEYKGKKLTLNIGQDGAAAAGINDVNAAENGAVEYFDVQGRKLQAAPANGFFLQRQGNKVTKVIR